jgi:hypothetical protein
MGRDWEHLQDPEETWRTGDPGKIAELLAAAYEGDDEIRRIARLGGLDWDGACGGGAPAQLAWRRLLSAAAAQHRVFDLMAEVLQDSASAEFHVPLGTLLGEALGVANALRAMRYGLPPAPAEGPDRMVESLREVRSALDDTPVDGFEALTSAAAGLDDPRPTVQAILDAMRRTALIEVAGIQRGTGFLVGPDLLLTAAHVIDSRQWPPVPLPEAWAVFDYDAEPGRSMAESGVRRPVIEFITASLPTDAETAATPADWNAPADHLDFALLRLGPAVPPEREPAAPRGVYRLDRTAYDFPASPVLFILQHPLGQFQKLSWIRRAPVGNGLGTRVRYGGNTLPGSSGSPVVDVRGRLVALHHYSESSGGSKVNQAVPISVIADALLSGPHQALFTALGAGRPASAGHAPVDIDPFRTNSLMGRPFVNRSNLRDRIGEMAKRPDQVRALAITGESGSGVSFSYRLIAHVAAHSQLSAALRDAAPGGLAAFIVDLSDYIDVRVDERRARITKDILVSFGLLQPLQPLAQDARHLTTLQAWLKTELRGSPRQWWVFFDSIDQLTLVKQGGVGELIHALIRVSDDQQVPLRVVLAGRAAEDFALTHSQWLEQDTAVGFGRDDAEHWFRARAAETGSAIDEARLRGALAGLFPAGQPVPAPHYLAPRLPKALTEMLEATDGS